MAKDSYSSSHPPLSPISEDDRFLWLRLLRSRRVGITTFYRLLDEHGTAQAALLALPEIAAQAGVSNYETCPEGVIEAELRAGLAAGAGLIAYGEPEYPQRLYDLTDAPPLLWVKGRQDRLTQPMIALVGARNASSLGTRMTKRLAGALGEAGYAVVSGLARGVDTAAHLASVSSGTVAVVAGGVDVIYPLENTPLYGTICADGAVLSEQPMGLHPQARHFPIRNRLISGLAEAVVVIEAAAKSGSLITARNALDQGRDVLAVPGHPFDARSAGCNLLIREGATLVRMVDDVLEAIDTPNTPLPAAATTRTQPPKPTRTLRDTARLHDQILERLGPSPMAEDQLIRDLKTDAGTVAPALIELEMDGTIERQAGGLLAKTQMH